MGGVSNLSRDQVKNVNRSIHSYLDIRKKQNSCCNLIFIVFKANMIDNEIEYKELTIQLQGTFFIVC